MRSTIVIVIATLALNLGSGSVLAQTGGEWRWLYSVDMLSAQVGWAMSSKGRFEPVSVVRTTNGGIRWKDVTPDAPSGQYFPSGVGKFRALTPLGAWALTNPAPLGWDGRSERDNVVFHTVDGGLTWRSATIPAGIYGWPIDFINNRDGWSVSGRLLTEQGRSHWDPLFGVHSSSDGGQTWTKVGSAELPHFPQSIAFLTANTGWITGNARVGTQSTPYVVVTRDGGRTWELKKLPVPPELTLADAQLVAESPQVLTGRDGILPVRYDTHKGSGVFFYVTHDAGTSWMYTKPLPIPSYVARGLVLGYVSSSFADANHGWVTDSDALYVTNDGGHRWTKMQSSLPFDRALGQLEFISPRVGWATGWRIDKPFLLKTLDGGRTWTSVPYVVVRR